MTPADVAAAVELQALAFPPPFPAELLWQADHLLRHLELFPAGQFVATVEGQVVGSCSNTLLTESVWNQHGTWEETVGGPFLDRFAPQGTTLYGLDITVHPGFRRLGIARRFYAARFDLVRSRCLQRYGTTCRMPDYAQHTMAYPGLGIEQYAEAVANGTYTDRTLTPLLRMGLTYHGILHDHMEDAESANAAAVLSWSVQEGIP